MKQGRSLTELAMEVERQQESKKDFVVSTAVLKMESGADKSVLTIGNGGGREPFGIGEIAHNQIAERVGIPAKYYDRMRSTAPELLDQNVNHWFGISNDRRMVRTLDGQARAFLSDRYRRLDNFDLMSTVLPVLLGEGQFNMVSTELTERKIYLKVVSPKLEMEVKKGDIVQAGLVISNSEIGLGAVQVSPLIYRLICLNGAIANDFGMKKYHVGRRIDGEGEEVRQLFSDHTLQLDDNAFFAKVRDLVRASFDEVKFRAIVGKMTEMTDRKIEGNPIKAIEVLSNKSAFTESERSSILRHFIEGADLSQYGIMNALTRTAQDAVSYDRATELESFGGQIIDMSPEMWKEISTAN